MVSIVLKASAYSLLFNLSLSIMMLIFPFASSMIGYNPSATNASQQASSLASDFQTSINPGPEVQQSGLLVLRLFDLVNIAFIQKFLSLIFNSLFGILTIGDAITAGWLDPTFGIPFWNTMNLLMVFAYIWAAIEIFTLRKVTG
jgi:hypothetical protein